MKKGLAAVALVAALLVPLAAKADPVDGTVVDLSTKHVLAGATVTLVMADGTQAKTTTDAQGRFAFDAASVPVAVFVQRAGYLSYTASRLSSGSSHLLVALSARLTVVSIDRAYSRCAAFQPGQVFVQYTLVPGECGIPKTPRP